MEATKRMKISTEIGSTAQLVGEEKAIELLAKAGFTGWDFSMFGTMWNYDRVNKRALPSAHPLAGKDYLAFARKLRQVGLDNGIVCNQSHAPFPIVMPEIIPVLKRAIECTAEAGGEICVVHPDKYAGPEENAEIYQELLPFAKEHGVKLATENMFDWVGAQVVTGPAACGTPESFKAHMDALPDAYFVACLDIGHAELDACGTSSVAMIEALGSRLQALHIHDNDRVSDIHQIPFSMQVDFEAIMKALKKNGYQGWLTLEANNHMQACTAETVWKGVVKLVDSAKKLAKMFEEA